MLSSSFSLVLQFTLCFALDLGFMYTAHNSDNDLSCIRVEFKKRSKLIGAVQLAMFAGFFAFLVLKPDFLNCLKENRILYFASFDILAWVYSSIWLFQTGNNLKTLSKY